MKFLFTLLGCSFAGLVSLMAQGVSVDLILDQDYFLAREALVVKVRITNYSGQTLKLGHEEDWLTFLIEGRNNYVVSKVAPFRLKGEYSLDSSRTGTIPIDLAPSFDLSRPGHYKVTASVKLPQWQKVVRSEGRGFDIVTGTKLWEQDFGMPQISKESPEVRKYALVQAVHLNKFKLYLRLSDSAETEIFRIFPVGPMVSLSKPEPQLDKYSNLHLLYQVGSRSFSYSVINPDGLIIAREAHDISTTRPKLRVDQDGRIQVVGGTRRITSSDLPPPLSSTLTSDAKLPQP